VDCGKLHNELLSSEKTKKKQKKKLEQKRHRIGKTTTGYGLPLSGNISAKLAKL